MNKSETIKELASAFAKAQSEFVGAVKDSSNPFFKSKYADLESVVGAIKPALTKHGLSFVQISHNDQSAAAIETIILHSSGEWLSAGIVSVPVSKNDAQGYGSAMTYARRYSLSAAFGIAPEDDDGNAAAKAKPGVNSDVITEEQLANIIALASEVKANMVEFRKYLQIDKLENLPAVKYSQAIAALEKKRKMEDVPQ